MRTYKSIEIDSRIEIMSAIRRATSEMMFNDIPYDKMGELIEAIANEVEKVKQEYLRLKKQNIEKKNEDQPNG